MNPGLLVVSVFVLFVQTALALPTAKITIKVIDEAGQPVAGANAGMVLEASKKKGQGWGTDTSWIPGITDAEGLFSAQGPTSPYVTQSLSWS